jgi:hypothetical protein
MSEVKHMWPSEAFDAISLAAFDGQFEIEGTDGDQVELQVDLEKRVARDLQPEPVERWLQIHLWERPGESQLTLRLPKKKAWVVDLSAGRGQVHVTGIQARLRVMLGKGEIRIEDCRGTFNLASGKGNVEIERCAEAEMPERPPMPRFEPAFQSPPPPEAPPVPEGPAVNGEFRFHFGRGPRMHHRMKPGASWEWFGFDADDWAEWGAQFGEQARGWAQQFVNRFVSQVDWLPEKAGLTLHLGKGDAGLEEVVAKSCTIQVGSGDVELEDGRIETLDVSVGRGGVEVKSVLPAEDWDLQVRHGDIRLSLPANARARLDVATRHGEINSQVPLVRVGRPGPEARHGGRMVGNVGQAEGKAPEISLNAMSGDIEIELQKGASKYSYKPGTENPPVKTNAPAPEPVVETAPAAAPTAEVSGAATEDKPAATANPPQYDSQLAILQALSEGHISVAEAEKLLQSLK